MINKYIMYKDIPVIKMNEENSIFTFAVLNRNFAPFTFLNKKDISSKEWQDFLRNRTPLLTDENANLIKSYFIEYNINSSYYINKLKENGKNNLIPKYIENLNSLLFYSTSITDSYWIKDENDTIEWKDINPRTHELKDICKDKELAKKLIYQNEVAKNNFTLKHELGASPKIWKHDSEENVFLYKYGTRDETQKEILVSNILKHTNMPYVKYSEVSERCCKCENIANENYALLNSSDLQVYLNQLDTNFETFCSTLNPDLYYGMQVIDFLIDNPDRTIYNQGFIRDNETGNIVDLQPLFDHNNAFSGKLDKLRKENPEQYKIILHNVKNALDKTCLKFDNTLNAGVFKDTEKYLSFMKRAEEIGLYSKNKDKGLFDNLKKNKLLYQINEKYKLTYKDLPRLELPCIEYDISKETFVISKAKKISEKQDEINKTISLITNKGHTVGVNFIKNTTIYNIDHKKYQYTHKLESMDNFLKYIEQKYLVEEYEKNKTRQMDSSIDISNEEIEQERDFYEF